MLHGKPEDLAKMTERLKQRRIEAQRMLVQAWSQTPADGTSLSFQERVNSKEPIESVYRFGPSVHVTFTFS